MAFLAPRPVPAAVSVSIDFSITSSLRTGVGFTPRATGDLVSDVRPVRLGAVR
jgi:hypothetical protein